MTDLFGHCLSGIRKAWETPEPDRDRWADWLKRQVAAQEQTHVIRLLYGAYDVTYMLGGRVQSIGTVLDIGCGSGRYAHTLVYDHYFGLDAWDEAIQYAEAWAFAESLDPDNVKFVLGSVTDEWPCHPDVVLTMNVFRHFTDPMLGYQHVWDKLPVGSRWITDFLTTDLNVRVNKSDVSMLLPESEMFDFLRDKTHITPLPWFKEVGTWWITLLQK